MRVRGSRGNEVGGPEERADSERGPAGARSASFGSRVMRVRGSRGNEVRGPKERTGTPDDVGKMC